MAADLPLFQCVRRARIVRIKAVVRSEQSALVLPADNDLDEIRVPFEVIERTGLRPGFMLAIGTDGYMWAMSVRDFERDWVQVDSLEERRAQLQRQLDSINAAIAAQPQGAQS